MTGSDLDKLLENAREEQSYFDDPEDLEETAEEGWARIETDPTMAKVLGIDPSDDETADHNQA